MSLRDRNPIALAIFMFALTAAALGSTVLPGKAHAYSTGPELLKFCKLVKEQNDYLRGFLGELEKVASYPKDRFQSDVTFSHDGKTFTINEGSVIRLFNTFHDQHAKWAEAFKAWSPGDMGNDCMERHRHVVKKLENIVDILEGLERHYD